MFLQQFKGILFGVLGQACPANTSATTLFTAPTGNQVNVDFLGVVNTDSSAASVTVQLVPKDETAALKHTIYKNATLGAGASVNILANESRLSMKSGDRIIVTVGTADKVCFTATGLTLNA